MLTLVMNNVIPRSSLNVAVIPPPPHPAAFAAPVAVLRGVEEVLVRLYPACAHTGSLGYTGAQTNTSQLLHRAPIERRWLADGLPPPVRAWDGLRECSSIFWGSGF